MEDEPYEREEHDDYLKCRNIILRKDQIKLLEEAKKGNSILYLPAGAGKTLIAIHLLCSRATEIKRPYGEGGKRAFFLAPTKVLVQQLFKVLQISTKFEVAAFTGDMNVDAWNRQKWLTKFENFHVLVLTGEIMKHILQLRYIKPLNISLIVLDECHHAADDHPYGLVLQYINESPSLEKPLRLGLSAVLLKSNTKKEVLSANIEALENLFKGKVITVPINRSYAAHPKEKIIIYKEDKPDALMETVFELYNSAIDELGKMVIKPQNSNVIPEGGFDFKNKNRSKRIKNSLKNSKDHFTELGVFGGCISALFHIILFEKYRLMSDDPNEIQALIYATTQLNMIRHTVLKVTGEVETGESIIRLSSSKIQELIRIIKESRDSTNGEDLSILIFVHQRVTAIVLSFLLNRLKTVDREFSFLKPEFIVGTSVFAKETVFLGTKNEDVVKQFAAGSLNLLVATNVLEEGIDISACNIVISLDFPLGYTNYFQSKGRARNDESSYYLLVNEEQSAKLIKNLSEYRNVEKELMKTVSESPRQIEEEEEEDESTNTLEKVQLSGKSGPIMVDALTAIKAVDRYCARLPQDRFSLLSPTSWYVKEAGGKRAFVQLPMSCPLREVLEGGLRASVKEAKRSAYLVALKRLHEAGVLDDELNASTFEVNKNFSNLFPHYKKEEIDKNQPQPGTRRRKQMYKVKYAECLSNCLPRPGAKAYLHVINLSVVCDKPELDRKVALYNILKIPVSFAIISAKKLCKICQFPLFLDFGQINCDFLVNYDEIVLKEAEINDIKLCHFSMFKKVTKILKNSQVFDNSNKGHSFFVVPVEKNEEGRFVLSWDVIRSDFCKNNMSALVRYNPTSNRGAGNNKRFKSSAEQHAPDLGWSEGSSTSLVLADTIKGRQLWEVNREENCQEPKFMMTEEDYRFFVIFPTYRNEDPPQYYIVQKFCRNMSPLSPFPRTNYPDYLSYYSDKYGIEITNTKQPLLKVAALYSCSNFNKPRNRKPRRARERIKEYEEHLIPELCDVVPFDSRYWVKALLIPTVLNRIYHIYCVEEFRRRIISETGLGMCELPEGNEWRPLEVDKLVTETEEVEDRIGIGGVTELGLKSSLPLSKLKDKAQPSSKIILDPERHMYEVGLCDLEFYVKNLLEVDDCSFPEFDLQEKYEEPEFIRFITEFPKVPVPDLEILNRVNGGMGPDLALLLQACTAESANDVFSYERLEILGDSFLKFATTLYLFKNHPENEGILTCVKGKMVGNRNLLYCGSAKNLHDVINVTDFAPLSDWNPPLLCVPEQLVSGIIDNNVDPAVLYRFHYEDGEQYSGVLSENTLQKNEEILKNFEKCCEMPASCLLPYKTVSDKVVSDCVEALIGTYLVTLGLSAACELLMWLSILPEGRGSFAELMEKPYEMILFGSKSNTIVLDQLREAFFSELEDFLNYRFNNKALLLEALTHPSYSRNQITNCYQRLEFLGDAILDFLVTSYIYENCGNLTPGEVTDIRSALVNNITFGCLVVRYELYKHLLSFSAPLSQAIHNFVLYQKNRKHVVDDNVLILLNEDNMMIAETVQVPKALGDLFESLAGAIFLDSGNSLETVWRIYYRLMKREIDEFTKNVPKTAVRLIHEICGDRPSYETRVTSGKTRVSCSVYYENQILKAYGFGENKKEAKRSASKILLNKIMALKK